jgi:formate dehydrogenase maturation protein FdhE
LTEQINLSKRIALGLEEWAGSARSSRFFDFYRKLLHLQSETEEKAGSPGLKIDRDEIAKLLASGKSILSFADLKLDKALVNETFHRVACLFAEYPEILGPVPETLISAAFSLPPEWIGAWFNGEGISLEINGESHPLLVPTLIQQTLRPFLIGYAQAFKGGFDQDKWRRSNCPVCGAKPEMAFLEKEVGARWCLCSACTTEWLFKRMQCPYCDNTQGTTLSYLGSEDGLYRLYFCEECKCYLKAVDLRKTTRDLVLPLESLTTVAMDAQAQEKGYHRGA